MASYVSQVISAGTSLVLSALDTATSTHIKSGGSMRITSGGEAWGTYISGGGVLLMSSGRASRTVVYSGGKLQATYYGGFLESTTVYSGGRVMGFLYTGASPVTISEINSASIRGVFSSATVESGYAGYIGSNGKMTSATVNGGGSMYVEAGGSAIDARINSTGYMLVGSGGSAINTHISAGGTMTVSQGRVDGTVVYSRGILSGGGGEVMSNTTVHSGGQVIGFTYTGATSAVISEINSNSLRGAFSSATVESRQLGRIGSRGIMTSATINGGGSMYVSAGGSAIDAQINSNGYMLVSGGSATNTRISAGGTMTVALGRAESTIVSSRGILLGGTGEMLSNTIVYSGGRVIGFTYTGGGSTTISEISSNSLRGTFSSAMVESGQVGRIGSKGVMTSGTINGGGYMYVSTGGSAMYTHVKSTGQMVVSSGGSAFRSYISAGGVLTISQGRVESTVVYSRGTLQGNYYYYEGVAIGTIVHSGGRVIGFTYTGVTSAIISEIASNTLRGNFSSAMVESGQSGGVGSNGVMTSGTINGGGYMYVSAGGSAVYTQINSSGRMYVSSGGSALYSYVSEGGILTVSQGQVDSTVVASRGVLTASYYGGVLSNTTVLSGGSMVVGTSTSLAGTTRLGGTMIVSSAFNANGIIYMDVSERKASDDAIISNIGRINNATYCITVSATQEAGTYKLAEGASIFSQSISIYNDSEALLGTFANGNWSFVDNGRTYTLTENSGTLAITVAGDIPTPTEVDVRTNLLDNGYSQIVAWDAALGKVGYVATDGQVAPPWTGIWEWGEDEVSMWKVVGVGRFSADVEHDGILLYNGAGNTFAAWTDLGRGDYGYVSLCHVDGNFQTLALADFDGNGLDDVIIYDENGSFGIVSDAAAYHDVWHVDNPETNVQQVIGAGYFGNADGKSDILVKKTDENAYFLWHNEDPTFETWNWSLTHIGSLDDDWVVAAIGDFQGDGVDDIIMWQQSTGFMYAWEDGKASKQRWVGKLDPSDWEVAAVGDYNGDGKEDLLLRELNSGWGGVGYWAGGSADNWTDLNARIETDMESKFAVIA